LVVGELGVDGRQGLDADGPPALADEGPGVGEVFAVMCADVDEQAVAGGCEHFTEADDLAVLGGVGLGAGGTEESGLEAAEGLEHGDVLPDVSRPVIGRAGAAGAGPDSGRMLAVVGGAVKARRRCGCRWAPDG
jgi:hypothetical protein